VDHLYAGKILWMDLTTGQTRETPTAQYAERFVGGRGVNAAILYELIGKDTEPLGPENVIVFGTGPLTGTLFPAASRTDVMSKSPVTGLLGDSSIGGEWGPELKYAGYDHLVITGRAPHPVYLNLRDGMVELRDARGLWGTTTYEAEAAIWQDTGDTASKVMAIGQAGENQMLYAAIQSGRTNTASRCGIGAVMGAKNLKAIVVRGTKGIDVADPRLFFERCSSAHHAITDSGPLFAEYSTRGLTQETDALIHSGLFCAGDAHENAVDFNVDDIDIPSWWVKYGVQRAGCMACPMQCMDGYTVPGKGSTVVVCSGYTPMSWELRNPDIYLWFAMTRRSSEWCFDSFSVATTIQWLMHLHALGILDSSLTDGIAMEWGSREAIDKTIENMVFRHGFGDVLAQGMAATAVYLDERIPAGRREDKSTYYWAMQINNLPMSGLTNRTYSQALGYSIGRRGDLYQENDGTSMIVLLAPTMTGMSEGERDTLVEAVCAEATEATGNPLAGDQTVPDGKASLVHQMGVATGVPDLLGVCKWHGKFMMNVLTPKDYAEAMAIGTGQAIGEDDIIRASLRTRDIERALDCKMGRRREHDTIPEKEFDKPFSRGSWKGKFGVTRSGLERAKDEWYELRGWDRSTGIPLQVTLRERGLTDVAEDLVREGLAI